MKKSEQYITEKDNEDIQNKVNEIQNIFKKYTHTPICAGFFFAYQSGEREENGQSFGRGGSAFSGKTKSLISALTMAMMDDDNEKIKSFFYSAIQIAEKIKKESKDASI